MYKKKGVASVVIIFLALISTSAVIYGQDHKPGDLEITLRRDFGYALAGQMQGSFSIIVESPEDLVRVKYILDDNVIGETLSSPHRYRFETKDYPNGSHRIGAIGYTSEGQEFQSNLIVRQFVPGNSVTIIVIVIIGIVLTARVGSYLLSIRSSESKMSSRYGLLGGAICPNCDRAFGIHWWSLRLGFARYDRCPHCGKWRLIKRASAERLMKAERSLDDSGSTKHDLSDSKQKDEDEYKRLIEESRYEKS